MIMKRLFISIITFLVTLPMLSQGWPEKYEGVMLQGFYWESYSQTKWTKLEKQADELSQYFNLVWLPQSAQAATTISMGYNPLYWFPGHYNSSFGTENELRSLIKTFKAKGIGTIADVVINHCGNVSNWVDFPEETYNGVKYQLQSTDICANDDDGKTKTWATQNGYTLSANNDTGEDFPGLRDLDHKSENVKKNVKAYLSMLLNDLGYTGFRYDVAKGFLPEFFGQYNEDAKPQFSVGECWDNSNTIKNWIEGTGKRSAAFDFQFKYVVRNAVDKNDWTYLGKQNDGSWPLVSGSFNSGNYRRYAVTFVENHDTEVRPDGTSNGPLRKDTLAANAYMMAMPGTPCVFLKHWIDCKRDIKAMIDVRNAVGLHNQSSTLNMATNKDYYAVRTEGKDNKYLVAVVGKQASTYTPNGAYTCILSGYHYAYWVSNNMETAWVDLPSGEYDGQQQALLTAVSANSDAQLVYTTDGTTPTASSTKVASGTKITIEGDMTLKVGLLIGSTVSSIVTRVYTSLEPLPIAECTMSEGEIGAFFEAPSSWNNDISCWAWSDSPSDNFTFANGGWPGVVCEFLGVAENGNKVWKWTWDGTKEKNSSATQPQKIIFNNTSSPQTDDLTYTNGGYYNKNGLVKVITPTGINEMTIGQQPASNGKIYTLSGQQVERPSKGIYIINGKKVVIN